MAKLNASPRVGLIDPDLQRHLRDVSSQVNALTEGRIAAVYNADSSVPLAGKYEQGDFVRNSAPTELGHPNHQYVIFGWLNVASGEPGTFVQCRFLTGN
jgi:hypothetical protein